MIENKNRPQLVWLAGDSYKLTSTKYAQRAFDILSSYEQQYETLTKSQVAGIALEYVLPPEAIQDWEDSVDARLDESDVQSLPLPLDAEPVKNNNFERYFNGHHAEFVGEFEFSDIKNDSAQITIPSRLKSAVDDAVDRADQYHGNNKWRFISNTILAWDASPFMDVIDRVRTKQQLLQASRGEEVENPTEVFEKIRDGELFEELQEVVEQAGANTGDITDIEPEDDVVLEEGEEPVWSELPQSPSARLGPFLAVLRRFAEGGTDGFSEGLIKANFDERNGGEGDGEYGHPDRFVEEYVLPYLHEGPDGDWYVYGENAEFEEGVEETEQRKEEVWADIQDIAPTGNAIGSAVRSATDTTVEKTGTVGSRRIDDEATLEKLSIEELGDALEYLEEKV